MDLYTIDVETFYSSKEDYTLTKMTTIDYILDPRFELLSVSIKKNFEPAKFYWGAEAEEAIRALPLERAAMLAHNTVFDAAVLYWRFRKRAAFYFDTMSMANAVVKPYTGSAALGPVARHFNIGDKDVTFIANANGKRRRDFTHDDIRREKDYNNADVDQCFAAYRFMLPGYPKSELRLIDQVVQMFVFPKLALKPDILEKALHEIRAEKERLLDEAHLNDRDVLMSNDKFAAVLGMMLGGMERVPTKLSPTTGKKTWAFSKKDRKFKDLLEHPNPAVGNIVAARLGHKSTLLETRTERLLGIAKRWRMLPAPLRYWAAHTGRFGGSDRLNLQNLTRGSQLRYAIIPLEDGYVLVVVDASQIEARFLVTWAEQWDVVDQFRQGMDVYALFAEAIFGHPVNKVDNPIERFVGKVGVLSLGYGAGPPTFLDMLWSQRTQEHVDAGFEPDIELAKRVVGTYRARNDMVKSLWKLAEHKMLDAIKPDGQTFEHGPFVFEPGLVHLPNGMAMHYPDIRPETDDEGNVVYGPFGDPRLVFGHGRVQRGIYGPMLVENLDQAATRIIITDAWLKVCPRFPVALQVHDELIFAVKVKDAETCLEMTSEALSTPPRWMPEIPLGAEGSIAPSYGEAK